MDTLSFGASECNLYTVYALIDPRDYTTRYIGITNDVYGRFAQHLRIDGSNPEKDAWIAELKQENVMLFMKTLEVIPTAEEARTREAHWIQHYLFMKSPILNRQIPTARIPSTPRQYHSQTKAPSTRKKIGRQLPYNAVREMVIYRYVHGEWPSELSSEMIKWYEFSYFVRPKREERVNSKKYARHVKSYERGRKWIAPEPAS